MGASTQAPVRPRRIDRRNPVVLPADSEVPAVDRRKETNMLAWAPPDLKAVYLQDVIPKLGMSALVAMLSNSAQEMFEPFLVCVVAWCANLAIGMLRARLDPDVQFSWDKVLEAVWKGSIILPAFLMSWAGWRTAVFLANQVGTQEPRLGWFLAFAFVPIVAHWLGSGQKNARFIVGRISFNVSALLRQLTLLGGDDRPDPPGSGSRDVATEVEAAEAERARQNAETMRRLNRLSGSDDSGHGTNNGMSA